MKHRKCIRVNFLFRSYPCNSNVSLAFHVQDFCEIKKCEAKCAFFEEGKLKNFELLSYHPFKNICSSSNNNNNKNSSNNNLSDLFDFLNIFSISPTLARKAAAVTTAMEISTTTTTIQLTLLIYELP